MRDRGWPRLRLCPGLRRRKLYCGGEVVESGFGSAVDDDRAQAEGVRGDELELDGQVVEILGVGADDAVLAADEAE